MSLGSVKMGTFYNTVSASRWKLGLRLLDRNVLYLIGCEQIQKSLTLDDQPVKCEMHLEVHLLDVECFTSAD